jgi:hypothetical protein
MGYYILDVCLCYVVDVYLTGSGQNNGNTKKFKNRICVGFVGTTSVGNTEYSSSICLQSVVLVSVH